MMSVVIHDLRYGFRLLAKSPATSIIAILTLAVGIGGNVALFSIVNSVLLKGLPFRDAGRLVFIHETRADVPRFPASYPDYEDWRQQNTTFQDMAGYAMRDYNKPVLMIRGEAQQISAALVSSNLFSLMGMNPHLGRSFLPEESRPGHDQVVILSQHLWQQQFSSDHGILGQGIELDGKSFVVVGVLREQECFPRDADIWLPITQLGEERLTRRRNRTLWVVGRLKPGIGEGEAFEELKLIQSRLAESYPEEDRDVGVVQVRFLDYYTGGISTVLMVLLGASSLVMLIACANIANLLLARALNRRKEVVIRIAHGATRLRIISQLLIESFAPASLGAAGGLAIALGGTAVLKRWGFGISHIPRLDTTGIDSTVLLYSIGVGILAALTFGTVPALQASRTDLNGTLKNGGRASRAMTRGRLRNLLIAAEVAVAVTVLVGTGLLARSLASLLGVDPGFRTDNLLAVQLRISPTKYSEYGRMEGFYLRLLDEVRTLPGVRDAAAINVLQIQPSLSLMHFGVEGSPLQSLSDYPVGQTRVVGPRYFDVMNIGIRSGRAFDASDLAETERGCIINETLARTYFPDQDPIGRRLLMVEAPKQKAVPIIGVAGDARDLGLDREPDPEMYFLGFGYDEVLLMHTAGDPLTVAGAIRDRVRSMDPYQPVGQIKTMKDVVDESLARRRFLAGVMALFSLLALGLCSVGIYGVVSYSAIQRISEIGVRMAIGATRADITGLLFIQGMAPVLGGLSVGLISSWSLRTVLRGLLYGVSSTDAATYLTVVAVIILTAGFAIVVPSLRVTGIDPMVALRRE